MSWLLEQRRQFPELLPTAVGGNFAGIASGRVLNAKHSTKSRSSQKSSRAVWERVAQAASSSSAPSASTSSLNQFPALERFPVLQAASLSGPAIRPPSQGQRMTPWTGSVMGSSSAPARPAEAKVQVVPTLQRSTSNSSKKSQRLPKLTSSQFPELPSSSAPRQKPSMGGNSSLKNILGVSAGPSVAAWQAGASESVSVISSDFVGLNVTETLDVGGEAGSMQGGGGGQWKGRKGKGKQKQTLFTLGSFPA